jgi:hypothetical protein
MTVYCLIFEEQTVHLSDTALLDQTQVAALMLCLI